MFIDFEVHSAKYNMEFDEKLLCKCEKEDIDFALRFYAWEVPSVTLGRNQIESGVNEEFCKNNNIPIVRRVTGGRALLHDKELTYCVVCNKKILKDGNNIMADYKELSGILLKALNSVGIEAYYGDKLKSNVGAGYCMNLSTICDINVNGKKFIGSAQYRKNTHILQHGSIPFSFDRELLKNIFPQELDFTHIISLSEISPKLDVQKFMKAIKLCFEDELKIREKL